MLGLAPKGEGNGKLKPLHGEGMKQPRLGTLLATAVASAILAAPGGAAKPTYSVTCSVGTGGLTTLTWISGTTGARVIWQDGAANPLGQADVTVTTNHRGSVNLNTPASAETVSVTFFGRKPAELAPATCTPV